jgi:DNA-directed RNA polymerase specialized sigma24 family protein
MTTIRLRPRYDCNPAELKLVRIAHHLWLDRRRALRDENVQDVRAIDESLRTVGELQRTVKLEDRKAA